MCPRCRHELRLVDRVGAALLSALPPATLDRAQPIMPEVSSPPPEPVPAAMEDVPAPLVRLMGGDLDAIRWRWIGPGLWHRPLPLGGGGSLQVIKAKPGASVPEHTHGGSEITLVLRGALTDDTGRYEAGDVADFDEDIEHVPVADARDGCICVIANEQPTRFRGLLARLMQPWHGL
jgi:putative transcriptional regulator